MCTGTALLAAILARPMVSSRVEGDRLLAEVGTPAEMPWRSSGAWAGVAAG